MNKLLTIFSVMVMILFSNVALSDMLDEGKDAMRAGDYAMGAILLGPLANNGYTEAQYLMGLIAHRGGLTIRFTDARRWYRMASRNGHVQSKFNLGILNYEDKSWDYRNNDGKQNFEKAANAGHPEAQYYLSMRYADGWEAWRGRNFETIKAKKWYDKAIEGGYVFESKIPIDLID